MPDDVIIWFHRLQEHESGMSFELTINYVLDLACIFHLITPARLNAFETQIGKLRCAVAVGDNFNNMVSLIGGQNELFPHFFLVCNICVDYCLVRNANQMCS